MKDNSARNLKLNMFVVLCSQCTMLVINFFSKQAVLQQLGKDYLGLQTVCGNFCDIMTLVFTALGMVMLFRLYRPLAENDRAKLSELFEYFRRTFRFFTIMVLAVGIIISVVVVLCVHADISVGNILFFYFLYLSGILIYNRYLYYYFFLMADQKRYIGSMVCGLVDLAALFFEIASLIITKDYVIFLVIIAVKNAVQSLILGSYVRRRYPYLRKIKTKGCPEERKSIVKDIKDMIVSRIGSLLLYCSDSIIISSIVNTAVAGCYSSYYYLSYGIQIILVNLFDTLMPKIGQLSVNNTKMQQFRTYRLVSLVNMIAVAVSLSGFFWLAEEFVVLWMGKDILLDHRLIIIMCINMYIGNIRLTSTSFRQAEGLFAKISSVILFRGIFNVIISILLGLKFGLLGIVAGTAIADGLTVFWYEPFMMHRFYRKSYKYEIQYQVLSLVGVAGALFITGKLMALFNTVSWPMLVVKSVVIVLGAGLFALLLAAIALLGYRRNRELMEREPEEGTMPPKAEGRRRISFIMPVYNGEDMVKRSIDSVLETSRNDIELIIVDDGSTDGTPAICDAVVASDSRARVFHKENGGQSIARNYGMRMATGDYIAFIDADDILLWDGMEKMIDIISGRKWDVVCGNYTADTEGGKITGIEAVESGPVIHDRENYSIYQLIKNKSVFGYCWNKLYRKDFLKENGLEFDDIRKVFMEDALFNLKVFSKDPAYYYCDAAVYEYYIRENTTSRKAEPRIAEKYADMLTEYLQYLKSQGTYKKNLDLAVPLAIRVFCWSMIRDTRGKGHSRSELDTMIKTFMENREFSDIVGKLGNVRELGFVTDLEQRLAYGGFFLLLHFGMVKTVRTVFYLGARVMRYYTDSNKIK